MVEIAMTPRCSLRRLRGEEGTELGRKPEPEGLPRSARTARVVICFPNQLCKDRNQYTVQRTFLTPYKHCCTAGMGVMS